MITSEALQTFFDDNFKHQITPFLLYKDNQLLKNGKHKEFAQEQLKKANKIFISITFAIIYGLFWGVTQLIEYGRTDELFNLIGGLIALGFTAFAIFKSTKEYYIIRSSMSLFLKLIGGEDKPVILKSPSSVQG